MRHKKYLMILKFIERGKLEKKTNDVLNYKMILSTFFGAPVVPERTKTSQLKI